MIQKFYISLFLPLFLIIFISIFFIPSFISSPNYFKNISFNSSSKFQLNSSQLSKTSFSTFLWPTPGYSKITSNFGYRVAPTNKASSYHGGIDIGAPENSSIISIEKGTVIFAGWYGANGYSIIIEHSNGYKSIYGHVSPNFLVSVGDKITKGELIAKVGPKYIPKKSYTTYKDSSGKYTNGATTRSTLTFCNK